MSTPQPDSQAKRAYHAPQMRSMGHLADVTQAGTTGFPSYTDSPGGYSGS